MPPTATELARPRRFAALPAEPGRALVLVAVALLAALALAAPAQAKPRFGVHVGSAPRADVEWERMSLGNVGVVRRSLTFNSSEAARDLVMRQTSDAGLRVLAVVIGSPRGGVSPPRSSDDFDRYERYVKDIVERYGRDGDFWCQSPEHIADCAPRYRPITDWQIWNEPSLDTFWDGDPDAREYAEVVESSRKAIESRDERGGVILAGMPYNTGLGVPLEKYLKSFYEVKKIEEEFDAVAVHPYGRDEDDVRFIMERLRSRLKDLGDGGREVWITEMGWGTDGPGDSPFVVSKSKQANLLTKSFKLLRNDRKRYDLDTVVWYDFRDSGPPPGQPGRFHHFSGLFEKNGEAKPAWPEFTDFSGGNPGGGSVPESASASKAAVARDPLDAGKPDTVLPPAASDSSSGR